MPLGEGFLGTNADSSFSREYCRYCYQNGAFTMPDLKLPGAIRAAVEHMRDKMNMGEEQAEVMANAVIPQLKRWRGHA